MTVPFSRVPSNLRTPLFYVEFDNSMANTATATQRTLLIGQMLSSGSAVPNILLKFPPRMELGTWWQGSQLHGMMTAYQKNDTAAKSGSCLWRMTLNL
jgi:phage tail sheath gpL-like